VQRDGEPNYGNEETARIDSTTSEILERKAAAHHVLSSTLEAFGPEGFRFKRFLAASADLATAIGG